MAGFLRSFPYLLSIKTHFHTRTHDIVESGWRELYIKKKGETFLTISGSLLLGRVLGCSQRVIMMGGGEKSCQNVENSIKENR